MHFRKYLYSYLHLLIFFQKRTFNCIYIFTLEQDVLGAKLANVRILEIGLLAPYVVSVIMQHPRLLCYTTIEIDVSGGNVETRFRDHNDLHNPDIISEIIRRCHSIPVTVRALLMKYKQAHNSSGKRRLNNNSDNNSDSNGSSGSNRGLSGKDFFLIVHLFI